MRASHQAATWSLEEGKDNVKIVDQIQEQYQLCKLTNLIETIKNKFDLYITNQNSFDSPFGYSKFSLQSLSCGHVSAP